MYPSIKIKKSEEDLIEVSVARGNSTWNIKIFTLEPERSSVEIVGGVLGRTNDGSRQSLINLTPSTFMGNEEARQIKFKLRMPTSSNDIASNNAGRSQNSEINSGSTLPVFSPSPALGIVSHHQESTFNGGSVNNLIPSLPTTSLSAAAAFSGPTSSALATRLIFDEVITTVIQRSLSSTTQASRADLVNKSVKFANVNGNFSPLSANQLATTATSILKLSTVSSSLIQSPTTITTTTTAATTTSSSSSSPPLLSTTTAISATMTTDCLAVTSANNDDDSTNAVFSPSFEDCSTRSNTPLKTSDLVQIVNSVVHKDTAINGLDNKELAQIRRAITTANRRKIEEALKRDESIARSLHETFDCAICLSLPCSKGFFTGKGCDRIKTAATHNICFNCVHGHVGNLVNEGKVVTCPCCRKDCLGAEPFNSMAIPKDLKKMISVLKEMEQKEEREKCKQIKRRPGEILSCDLCHFETVNRHTLRTHKIAHLRSLFHCPQCDGVFRDRRHIKRCNGIKKVPKRLTCNYCNHRFCKVSQRISHEKSKLCLVCRWCHRMKKSHTEECQHRINATSKTNFLFVKT